MCCGLETSATSLKEGWIAGLALLAALGARNVWKPIHLETQLLILAFPLANSSQRMVSCCRTFVPRMNLRQRLLSFQNKPAHLAMISAPVPSSEGLDTIFQCTWVSASLSTSMFSCPLVFLILWSFAKTIIISMSHVDRPSSCRTTTSLPVWKRTFSMLWTFSAHMSGMSSLVSPFSTVFRRRDNSPYKTPVRWTAASGKFVSPHAVFSCSVDFFPCGVLL